MCGFGLLFFIITVHLLRVWLRKTSEEGEGGRGVTNIIAIISVHITIVLSKLNCITSAHVWAAASRGETVIKAVRRFRSSITFIFFSRQGQPGWVAWPREVVNHHPVGHFGSPCLRLGHKGCRPVDAHIVTSSGPSLQPMMIGVSCRVGLAAASQIRPWRAISPTLAPFRTSTD